MGDAVRTVLIVEDNDDNRAIYSTYLAHFGLRVLEAIDGEQGLALARDATPDIILMDVSIPVVDGLEATRRLKADPATAGIPVIILTAHALASDRKLAFEAGADGYLAKPAEPRAVMAEVNRILAGRAAS